MSIELRCLRWMAIGLAALAPASMVLPSVAASAESTSSDSAITVSANHSRVDNVRLEIYRGRLDAGGEFEIRERGYLSLVIDDARAAPTIVQCSITPSSRSPFVIRESFRAEGARDYELTGRVFDIAVHEPADAVELAVTPERDGDHAYSIQPRDKASFAVRSCTVKVPSATPLVQPHRVTPTRTVSESGELALAEAEFMKWLRDEVVFDVGDAMTLDVGTTTPDPVVVRCQLDLDLAEQTRFVIEIDEQNTISQPVKADGRLSFTLFGGQRAKISNPTHMWIWRSCELD